MEKIIKIEEVTDTKLENTGYHTEKATPGIHQMLSGLLGCASYDGYRITTSEHVYNIMIDNGQNCCENWGYFSSDDNFDDFIGKEMMSVEVADKALNVKKVEESGYYEDGGGIQFVNFNMHNGAILQFAVYNAHNGYYGHPIVIAKDNDIILQDTL